METTVARKIDFNKHTKEELLELARDVNDGKVFGSWNILNVRLHPKKLALVFRSVGMAYGLEIYHPTDENEDPRTAKKFVLIKFKRGYPIAEDVRHFYEYWDNAIEKNFRDSGMPMFTTCRALDVDECVKLNALMEKEKITSNGRNKT